MFDFLVAADGPLYAIIVGIVSFVSFVGGVYVGLNKSSSRMAHLMISRSDWQDRALLAEEQARHLHDLMMVSPSKMQTTDTWDDTDEHAFNEALHGARSMLENLKQEDLPPSRPKVEDEDA